jgi:hypothetical protein
MSLSFILQLESDEGDESLSHVGEIKYFHTPKSTLTFTFLSLANFSAS